MQGQLALCIKSSVTLWFGRIIIEKITRDLPFWEKLIAKLTAFYVENMLPELISHGLDVVATEHNCDKEKNIAVVGRESMVT